MLTADLVRARRQGDELVLVPLGRKLRARAVELAAGYIEAAEASVGEKRAAFDRACAAVPTGVRDRKLAAGMRKLVADRCEFQVAADRDPAELRAEVFLRAARARRTGGPFDRTVVVAGAASALGLEPRALEEALYADIRDAHVLRAFDRITPEALLDAYELGQAQAVLLRATRVVAQVYDASSETYRMLFRRIKFHRLLHRIEPLLQGGYRIEISGPFSLFRAVTKYGLQLALVLPAVRACDRWSIEADVRWGRERRPVRFRLDGARQVESGSRGDGRSHALLPDEVRTLLDRFEARNTAWAVSACADVMNLPGVGLCVPDLLFEHRETGARAYLEVLGYWSRQAVWRRVELAQRGLPSPIVFAVSSRLRVSREVLDDDLPAALYVYKGSMSAAAVEACIEHVAGVVPSPIEDTERTS